MEPQPELQQWQSEQEQQQQAKRVVCPVSQGFNNKPVAQGNGL